jgi:hypothetical protein
MLKSPHTEEPDPAGSEAAHERRTSLRLLPGHVTIALLGTNRRPRSIVGRVADVSRDGLGLLTKVSLEPGDLLRIELIGTAAVVACVRHATAHGEGRWLIGCGLLEPLSADVLKKLTS